MGFGQESAAEQMASVARVGVDPGGFLGGEDTLNAQALAELLVLVVHAVDLADVSRDQSCYLPIDKGIAAGRREHVRIEIELVVDQAREQLGIIGAPVPEVDSEKKAAAGPVRPGFMGNLMKQVSGRADVTVDKDGILISKDGKEGTDLIDEALKYNGELPANTTPSQRSTRPTAKPVKDGVVVPVSSASPGVKP